MTPSSSASSRRSSGSCQSFGPVEIFWRPLSNRLGFDVAGAWGESLFLEATLSETRPQVSFSVRPEDERSDQEVVGRLAYSRGSRGIAILTLDLKYPGGEVVGDQLAPPSPPPPPPPPPPHPDPGSEPDTTIIDAAGHCDLFPYVYLRPGPEISSEALENHFVEFLGDCSDPTADPDNLYCNLVAIRGAEGEEVRSVSETEAVNFIEGAASYLDGSYAGIFVDSMASLPQRLRRLAPLDRRIRNRGHITFREFQLEVIEALDLPWLGQGIEPRWQEVAIWIRDSQVQGQLSRVWQSFFALSITLGYRTRLLEHLILILVMANLLERTTEDELVTWLEPDESEPVSEENDETAEMPVLAYVPATENSGLIAAAADGAVAAAADGAAPDAIAIDELASDDAVSEPTVSALDPEVERLVPSWPSRRILQGARATVVLPVSVFPLPAFGQVPPSPDPKPDSLLRLAASAKSGWIEPYAIGDLELVRQRLVGYELGEVSAIENVLRGSKKETRQRNLQRDEEVREESTSQEETTEALNEDLQNEVHKVLQGTLSLSGTYSSVYGPPTDAEVTGDFSQELTHLAGENGAAPYAEDFAKTITAQAANRVSRSVVKRRASSSLRENEETVVHRFDASDRAENMAGIYRWVNKVYSMEVVNYGHRLILEFLIPNPAEAYIQSELALQGVSLQEPKPLNELGVRNYTDISAEPKSRQYYASLASRYGADQIEPPPADELTVAITLQAGAPLGTDVLEVPAGYRAVKAVIVGNWPAETESPSFFGVVGNKAFSLPGEGEDPKRIQLEMAGETGSIPVAAESGANQEDGAPSTSFLATVEVVTIRGERLFEQWQTKTYVAIVEASDRRRAEYFEAAGATPTRTASRNPLASREAENKTLRNDVVLRLLQRALNLQGEPDPQNGDQNAAQAEGQAEVQAEAQMSEGPPAFEVNQPRYYQFLHQALEWQEMSYSFAVYGEQPSGNRGRRLKSLFSGADSVFTAFLQATDARVLVPVHPAFVYRLLYFLAAGVIWDGEDVLTPANNQSIPLINDWKLAVESDHRSRVIGTPWKVRVPTAMVKLQESSELPCINLG